MVIPGDALIRYTVPMPDDSFLAGRVTEKVALDASVLSTVHVTPPSWTESRTLVLRFGDAVGVQQISRAEPADPFLLGLLIRRCRWEDSVRAIALQRNAVYR